MSPRRRSEKRRNFPANLYETGGYYSWRHPKTGEHFGLGRDRARAFREAIEANASLGATASLVERISKKPANLWADWCDRYEEVLAKRDIRPNTRRTYKALLKRARGTFEADTPAVDIDTQRIADAVDSIVNQGKERLAQSFRAFLFDMFRVMIAKGWRKDNPVAVTDFVHVSVKRARLTLEVLQSVYSVAPTMLKNAIALALVTGQAREECCHAEFKDIHDGDLWIERHKTGARIRIPLSVRLDCFGMSLEDVVKQCRATGVVSHFLLHRVEKAKGARIGSKVHVDILTRSFSAAIDKLGLEWGGKQAPTFHEIRSLAGRLHKEQGQVSPQELLGHKDPRTTAIYTDGRGEWVKVSVRP